MDAAAATLAAAFVDYAWTDWTVASDQRERRLRESFALILGHVVVPHGELWIAGDHAAAAIWIPPGRGDAIGPAFSAIAARLDQLAGDRAEAAQRAEQEAAVGRPAEPHWYLASMGTRPDLQGRGFGSAVLGPVLARLDQRQEIAYTETSTRENVDFYQRRGFEVLIEIRISGGGPPVWPMLRR